MASSNSRPKVAYTFLGKSGLKVSNICLGTVTFGKREDSQYFDYPTQLTDDKAYKLLDRYAELGGNFIDTSDNYGYGHAEEIVGMWLERHDRESMVVSTKVRFCTDGTNVNSGGLSRKHMVNSCERSLERLKTSYIDLYQAHMWDAGVPLEETLRTFDDLIRSGKIRYFGFSNVCGWQLQKIVDTCKHMGINPCISLQQQYNLLTRYPEFEEFQVCKNEGIGVLPWSPLKGGVLTGKFKRGEKVPEGGSRVGFINANRHRAKESAPCWAEYANDEGYWNLMEALQMVANNHDPGSYINTNRHRAKESASCWAEFGNDEGNWNMMETLQMVANNHGRTIPQIALRWLLQKDVVTAIVSGATSIKQLEDNLSASSEWALTQAEMYELDEASSPEVHYPHSMIIPNNKHRYNKCNK